MRVISGIFKGKRLFCPPTTSKIRPTADRVKEAIFSILNSMDKLTGCTALDLFCGSGGIGIEALSRGAKMVYFVDIDKDSLNLTTKNIKHAGAKSGTYKTFHADFKTAIKKIEDTKFDIIFCDPPYKPIDRRKKDGQTNRLDADDGSEIEKTADKNIEKEAAENTKATLLKSKNDYTKALDLIKENKILKSDGVVVFEHSGKNDLQSFLDCSTIDTRKFGTTYISFIKNLS